MPFFVFLVNKTPDQLFALSSWKTSTVADLNQRKHEPSENSATRTVKVNFAETMLLLS